MAAKDGEEQERQWAEAQEIRDRRVGNGDPDGHDRESCRQQRRPARPAREERHASGADDEETSHWVASDSTNQPL